MADDPADLLARLNALRPTTVSLDHSRPNLSIPGTLQTPDTLLSDRLRALRNGGGGDAKSSSSGSHLPLTFGVLSNASAQTESAISSLDSPIVEIDGRADRKLAREALDFARGVSHDVPVSKSDGRPSREGSKVPTPEDVIRRLREEAADSLSDSDKLLKSEGKHKIPKNAGSRDSDARDSPAGESDAEKFDDEAEAREAEEILARLLDEAHLEERDEAANQPQAQPPPPQTQHPPPTRSPSPPPPQPPPPPPPSSPPRIPKPSPSPTQPAWPPSKTPPQQTP
ncbi:hypothetical protein GMDG_02767 [Pseudogymnoascus destructans 20631-21]|uniref:Uncharacterized protein n=1 Tax=Pseudogymnoascus destructans (strain ATCC MYA-4855 / 20631-21) TaxID=658429 RepID=L8G3P3_PSED2|nr:hypothetical protein GMDG_02767 [Pseudogymnoascus destructans 20631-21]